MSARPASPAQYKLSTRKADLALKAGQLNVIKASAGEAYRVLKRAEGSTEDHLASDVVAQRSGSDLNLDYADGTRVTLQDYFNECKGDGGCAVTVAGDTPEGHVLNAGSTQGASLADGSTVMYAHGSPDALASMVPSHGGLEQPLAGLQGDALTYIPQDGHGMGWLLAGLGGAGVVAALAGSGGGGGSKESPAVSNSVKLNFMGGPALNTNDLSVEVYQADGKTKLGTAKLHADGTVTVNVGSYSGVVVVKLINGGAAADYLDEATGVGKDLSAQLYTMGVITQPNSTLNLNVNVLTTIAYTKAVEAAGGSLGTPPTLTAQQVSDTASAISKVFQVDDVLHTGAVATNGGSYNAADGLSAGEKYGAVLAAFSGADKLGSGHVQQTIDTVLAGITVTGNNATIQNATQAKLVEGAKATVPGASSDDPSGGVSLIVDTYAPVFSSAHSATVNEHSGAGQVVYTAQASDPSAFGFSLGGPDAAAFSIDAKTGKVTLLGDPDHEAKGSYSFIVYATDVAGNRSAHPVTLNVADLNEGLTVVVNPIKAIAIGNGTTDDSNPQVSAAGTDGSFVATWQEYDENGDLSIYVRKFDANGLALGEAVKFEAIGSSSGRDDMPQATAIGHGGAFVVTWYGENADLDRRAFVQTFDAQGRPTGDVQRLDVPGRSDQCGALGVKAHALGQDGAFMVVWSQNDADAGDSSIFIQRFDTSGHPVGAPFQIESPDRADGNDDSPQVSMLGHDGAFVLTWSGVDADGDYSIYVQRFDPQGQPIGVTTRLEPAGSTDGDDHDVQITALGDDGAYVVTWQGKDASYNTGVFVQRFLPDGSKATPEPQQVSIDGDPQDPQITAVGRQGAFVVTWTQYDGNDSHYIHVQRFRADGSPDGPSLKLDGAFVENHYDRKPQITALGADGAYVVTWQGIDSEDGTCIYVQEFRADGSAATPIPLQLRGPDTHGSENYKPQVSAAGTEGGYVVTWVGQDTSGHEQIFVQRFHMDGPILGLDTTRNQGDSVEVQSSGTGTVYLVHDSVAVHSLTDITGAAGQLWNSVAVTQANKDTSLSLAGLADGRYHAYAVAADGSLSLVSANSVTMDSTGPAIQGIAITGEEGAQDHRLNAGDKVFITVTLSEPAYLQVNNSWPTLTLDIGGQTVQATCDGMDWPGTTMRFSYTIQDGQNDADGIRIPANALNLQGSTLKDAVGNHAQLNHAAVADNPHYLVDTQAPTATLPSAIAMGHHRTVELDSPTPDSWGTSDNAPQVHAVGQAGEYVVVWGGAHGDLDAIFVQKFNADGTTTGHGAVAVGGETGGNNYPQVSGIGSHGEFVVTWQGSDSDQSDTSIHVQIFNADGSPKGAPIVLEPADQPGGWDASPQLQAIGSQGDFVVVWSARTADGSASSVYVQKLHADGSHAGDMVQLDGTNSPSDADGEPQVLAIGDTGEFVVAWSGQDPSGNDHVFVQRFQADGRVQGSPVFLTGTATVQGGLTSPHLTALGTDGAFVVTWSGKDPSGDDTVFAQRFDTHGQAEGSLISMATPGHAPNFVLSPQVSALGNGDGFAVTWSGRDDSGNSNVFVQKVDAAGVPSGIVTLGGAGWDGSSQVCATGSNGGFVVVWSGQDSEGDSSIFVQVFNAAGQRVGTAPIHLEGLGRTDGADHSPQVSMVNSDGTFAVTWTGQNRLGEFSIYVQQFNADGSTDGPVRSDVPLGTGEHATVQSNEVGTAYLVHDSIGVRHLSDITQAADSLWNRVDITQAHTNTTLSTDGLVQGHYKLYTVDAAGNLSASSINDVVVDHTAPELVGSSPADDAATFEANKNLTLTFNENVQAATGHIRLVNDSNPSDTRTLGITDSTQVLIQGKTVTLNPALDLQAGAHYHVEIDATALTDAAGNAYAGIANATSLNFTTSAPPSAGGLLFVTSSGVYLDEASVTPGNQGHWDGGDTQLVRFDGAGHWVLTSAATGGAEVAVAPGAAAALDGHQDGHGHVIDFNDQAWTVDFLSVLGPQVNLSGFGADDRLVVDMTSTIQGHAVMDRDLQLPVATGSAWITHSLVDHGAAYGTLSHLGAGSAVDAQLRVVQAHGMLSALHQTAHGATGSARLATGLPMDYAEHGTIEFILPEIAA